MRKIVTGKSEDDEVVKKMYDAQQTKAKMFSSLLPFVKRCSQCKKTTQKEMFASKRQEIESQPHKAKSAIAHIAFLPTLTKLNKEF